MNEKDLEAIEKIVQHTVKTMSHPTTAPETRELIKKLEAKLDDHITKHDQEKSSIERIEDKLDSESDHYILKDVLPIIEAYRSSKFLGESLKWLTGVVIAFFVLKGYFK